MVTRRIPFKRRYIFFFVLIILFIISIQGFFYMEKNLQPALMEIANAHVKQIATLAINQAISQKISENLDDGGVLKIETSADGKTQLISFDSKNQAKILNKVVSNANAELLKLGEEPIKIPLGQALNSNILAQLGPHVPISLYPHGFSKADITVDLKEAGINMVMVTAYIEIEAQVQIIIPFSSEEALITTRYPIEWHLLQGEVPNVYFRGGDGQTSNPPISIPLDELEEQFDEGSDQDDTEAGQNDRGPGQAS
jgi:sporulation protein YunB